ncbi:MAG: TonB-dependent receptor [Alphaproteobacteria bacterium]|nr:TonB-dependent receptor [Alphaproteobacteria bacterium]
MKLDFAKTLLAGASAIAICATGAYAQDETERRGSVSSLMETITVTATKRQDAENVQDVPLSISAYNADTLDALNMRDLESLSYTTPNVTLDDIATSRGTANFAIRGLGVNSSIPSIDPTVGVFIDGVYMGYNGGLVFDMFDLDSIEVLRGPQGLLFGRNTTGGAIVINTGSPTDEFTWAGRFGYETPIDDDRGSGATTVQGYVSGPIVEGVLNGRLAAYRSDDEGYFRNLFDGSDHGANEATILRGSLEWFPSDNLTILARIENSTGEGDGPSTQNRGIFERDTFDLSIDERGFYDSDAWLGSIRADLDVSWGNGTITNIFGFRDSEGSTRGDIDSTPGFFFHSSTETTQEQISNELRYAGTFGRIDLTAGIYYFDQEIAYTETRDLPTVSPATFFGGGRQDHSVFGVFSQIDYSFTENFIGSFGLRYSSEEKDADITYVRPRPTCSVVDGTCPTSGTNPLVPGENNGFSDSDEWSNVTPKIGFQYFPNENTNIYGNYTRGFRSGGYNFRITAPAPFEAIVASNGGAFAFDEETVDSYEIGLRTETSDGRGQLSAAAFMTEIEDMQREVNASDPNAGVVQTILNTADATITGFEFEGRYAITENFLVMANLGIIDAEYDEVRFNISSDPTNLVNGDDLALALPRVPETTWGIGFIHDLPLGNAGDLSTRVNYQYRDELAYTDNNFGWIQEAGMLDANLTWYTPVDGLEVSIFGRNLLDEVQAGGDTQLPFGGNVAPLFGLPSLNDGVNQPFGDYPEVGTLSPLKPGRTIGFELTISR